MPGQGFRLAGLLADRSGSLLPIVVGGVLAASAAGALAVDLSAGYMLQAELKRSADAVALAAASDLHDPHLARRNGLAYAEKNLEAVYLATTTSTTEAAPSETEEAPSFTASRGTGDPRAARLVIEIGVWDGASRAFRATDELPNAVRVTLSRHVSTGNPLSTFFARVAGINELSIAARSIARQTPPSACVLALNPSAPHALRVNGVALRVRECGVHANSTDAVAVEVGSGATLQSIANSTSGGVSGTGSISPAMQTNAPPIADPFAGLPPPPEAAGPCTFTGKSSYGEMVTLAPGVYCGGLNSTDSNVTMAPGVYVMRSGAFNLNGNSSLSGDGVFIYLEDSGSPLSITSGGTLDISAPTSGAYEGMLIAANPADPASARHKVAGSAGAALAGHVYLPNARLAVTGSGGAYAVEGMIVVDTLEIGGSGAITLDRPVMAPQGTALRPQLVY